MTNKVPKRDLHMLKLWEEDKWSYSKIARKYHLSRQRVTYILKRLVARRKLPNYMAGLSA